MKTFYLIISAWMICFAGSLSAQTMRLIPSPADSPFGKCSDQSTKNGLTQCFALEYTPAVSGVLTSYTTGFLVSCTSLGSAVAKNQSCCMTPKNNEVNGCSSIGKTLVNSSGNSGTITNNLIEAGVPVILHQICLTIPTGEAVTIEEEPVTDLTTSIDVGNGSFVTEFPSFESATFRRYKYDDAVHTAFLDFQVRRAGELKAQLDWSTPGGPEVLTYHIEHSTNGQDFSVIGEVIGVAEDIRISNYRFFDEHAFTGMNYYRLRQTDANGKTVVSPIRELQFKDSPMVVTATPNPVKDKLYIHLYHSDVAGTATMTDVSGKERMLLNFDPGQANLVLDVEGLEQGIYTLHVKSGNESFVEKIVVVK